MTGDLSRFARTAANVDDLEQRGRVRSVIGLAIRAVVPDARIGDIVWITRSAGLHVAAETAQGNFDPLRAEVVGFEDCEAVLMPLGDSARVSPNDEVHNTAAPLLTFAGDELLGRVVDGLGVPIDGGAPLPAPNWLVDRAAPAPLSRARIGTRFSTGVRAIDALQTLGRGQRVGLFAGSGVGKSTLLGQIARQAEADVFITCLVGERGREVREFLEDSLGAQGLARGVVVCATSDAPALVRLRSASVATAIAEWFRDQGKNVLFLMDSVTRFARAAREVGLAAGEPPARRGYPPSVFAMLPKLLERSGPGSNAGTITGVYTVLVEGGDMEEPIADEVRGILDGHIVLDRAIAARGRFPAIDPIESLSRLMDAVVSESHRLHASQLREALALYEEKRDLVLIGAYKRGTDTRLDWVLDRLDRFEEFLRQRSSERADFDETVRRLGSLS